MNSQRVYSVAEGCEYLRIKRTLFYQFVNDGALNIVKIGRRTVVLKEELDRFLEAAAAKGA